MAATPNSTYQSASQQHNAGIPPNTQAQQANETFATYQVRMNCCGLQPDILPTESDATYLARLATYVVTSSLGTGTFTATNAIETNNTVTNLTALTSLVVPFATTASYVPVVVTGSAYLYTSASVYLLYAYTGTGWHSSSLA